jgi:hypothetical protein
MEVLGLTLDMETVYVAVAGIVVIVAAFYLTRNNTKKDAVIAANDVPVLSTEYEVPYPKKFASAPSSWAKFTFLEPTEIPGILAHGLAFKGATAERLLRIAKRYQALPIPARHDYVTNKYYYQDTMVNRIVPENDQYWIEDFGAADIYVMNYYPEFTING